MYTRGLNYTYKGGTNVSLVNWHERDKDTGGHSEITFYGSMRIHWPCAIFNRGISISRMPGLILFDDRREKLSTDNELFRGDTVPNRCTIFHEIGSERIEIVEKDLFD